MPVMAVLALLVVIPRLRPSLLRLLVLPALAFYAIWWFLYVVWILVDGVTRPQRGYDTVFANFAPVVMEQLGISPEMMQMVLQGMAMQGMAGGGGGGGGGSGGGGGPAGSGGSGEVALAVKQPTQVPA